MRSSRLLQLSIMVGASTMVAWGAVAPWTTAVPDIDNPSERHWRMASAIILVTVSIAAAVAPRFVFVQRAAVIQVCAAVALAWSDTSAKTGSFQDAPSPGQIWTSVLAHERCNGECQPAHDDARHEAKHVPVLQRVASDQRTGNGASECRRDREQAARSESTSAYWRSEPSRRWFRHADIFPSRCALLPIGRSERASTPSSARFFGRGRATW